MIYVWASFKFYKKCYVFGQVLSSIENGVAKLQYYILFNYAVEKVT